MAYIALLSSVLSFFLIAISADVQDIMVDKYHVNIEIYPTNNALYVTCYFVFKNLRKTDEISMYTEDPAVPPEEVSMIKKDTNITFDFRTYKHNSTTGILTFYLYGAIDPGLYVMNVTIPRYFRSAFNQVYFDHINEKEEVWLSSTHFQPVWVQRIIPCWIRPKEDTSWRDMPTFSLSILHFAHHSVLTNMPMRGERLDEEALFPDMKWTYFDTTPRVSPYQLSIVMTNFTRTIINEDDIVSMWCRNRSASSLHFALMIARNITTYLPFSRELRCRFSKRVNLIVIPKIQNSSTANFPERNDSLVHPGIIIANEDDITYNKENDTVGRKYNVIRLLGYKITQEHYEWIVNPYWQPSTWLSKGFAMFIATHNLNQFWPRMIDLFVVQIQHECLDFDVDNKMLPFPDQNGTIPVEYIDNMRASVLLRMLQSIISEPFWKVIDTFVYDSVLHKKERHLKMFWKALKVAHGKIKIKTYLNQEKTYDIDDLMHLYVEGKGYPVLTVRRYYDSPHSGMDLIVGNIKYRTEISEEQRPIPLSYTTRTNMNFKQTQPHEWITSPYSVPKYKLNLKYKENSWIIFNIQQTGYYRVNYDDENWARISKYLNNRDYWKIHVLNRAQLIDDAFQFMLLSKLKADIFWQLTKYLERERDYIAWYPMFKAIEYMSTSFQFYSKLRSILANLGKMLNMLLQKINYKEELTDNDFTKALRQEAAQWACSLKISNCTKMATILLKQHLGTHTNRLSPWWKKWTYCYGLEGADNITWHQTLNKIKGNDNDKFLYLITCPNHLDELNNYYTNDDVKSRINPSTMVQFDLKFRASFQFAGIKLNRHIKLPTTIVILINNIHNLDHLNRVQNALKYVTDIPGIPNKLEVRKNQLDNYNRLLARIEPKN